MRLKVISNGWLTTIYTTWDATEKQGGNEGRKKKKKKKMTKFAGIPWCSFDLRGS